MLEPYQVIATKVQDDSQPQAEFPCWLPVCSCVISSLCFQFCLSEYETKSTHYGVDVFPNQCVTFKTCPGADAFCFTNKIAQQHSHRLYRKDIAFFQHPYLDIDYFESELFMNEKTLCPFYNSRYVRSKVPACETAKCSFEKEKYSVVQARDHKLKMFSSATDSFHQTLIETEVIEYPSGTDSSFTNAIVSFYPFRHKLHITEVSMISSSIYHINCSKTNKQIADWSGLKKSLIDEICRSEETKVILLPKNLKYQLQPPYPDNKHSNLWSLTISISRCFAKADNYGCLAFYSHIANRLWNRAKLKKLKSNLFVYWHGKIPQQTALLVQTKLHSRQNVFELGFQKFEAPRIMYHANVSLSPQVSTCELAYLWTPCSVTGEEYVYLFQRKLQLLQFAEIKHSWVMAVTKCKEYGMTLPHFKSEKFMRQFVSYILNKFTLPIYALFVGMLYKVRDRITCLSLLFFIFFLFEPFLFCASGRSNRVDS